MSQKPDTPINFEMGEKDFRNGNGEDGCLVELSDEPRSTTNSNRQGMESIDENQPFEETERFDFNSPTLKSKGQAYDIHRTKKKKMFSNSNDRNFFSSIPGENNSGDTLFEENDDDNVAMSYAEESENKKKSYNEIGDVDKENFINGISSRSKVPRFRRADLRIDTSFASPKTKGPPSWIHCPEDSTTKMPNHSDTGKVHNRDNDQERSTQGEVDQYSTKEGQTDESQLLKDEEAPSKSNALIQAVTSEIDERLEKSRSLIQNLFQEMVIFIRSLEAVETNYNRIQEQEVSEAHRIDLVSPDVGVAAAQRRIGTPGQNRDSGCRLRRHSSSHITRPTDEHLLPRYERPDASNDDSNDMDIFD